MVKKCVECGVKISDKSRAQSKLYCDNCRRIKGRECSNKLYKKTDRSILNKRQQEWRAKNKDKVNLYLDTYKNKYPEKVASRISRWRMKNVEKLKEDLSVYREANRERINNNQKQSRAELEDPYVRKIIVAMTGLRSEDISDEMILMKREAIEAKRIITKLKGKYPSYEYM